MIAGRQVPRRARQLNVVAAAIFLVGAACLVRAWFGLEELRALGMADYAPGMRIDRLARYHAWMRLSWVGLGTTLLALAAAVASTVMARAAKVAIPPRLP